MVRRFTNIRKSQFISTQHTFLFDAVNTVFSDGRAAWHANCLEDFRFVQINPEPKQKRKMTLMKISTALCTGALIGTGTVLGLLLMAVSQWPSGVVEMQASAAEKPPALETTNAPSVPSTNNALLPDQSHAMVDVGYHFANLWFAADKENWPLAKYYLQGTRSHLNWAVRLHPVRTTSTGSEVNLNGILQAIDSTYLTQIDSAITNKDTAKFKAAYRQTLEGCYACHTACEKPFLRPQVPTAPSATILNFAPNAASTP